VLYRVIPQISKPRILNPLQVINCYMRLLMESFGRKRVHIMSTFFYTKLRTAGYKGVERWLKNVRTLYQLMVNKKPNTLSVLLIFQRLTSYI